MSQDENKTHPAILKVPQTIVDQSGPDAGSLRPWINAHRTQSDCAYASINPNCVKEDMTNDIGLHNRHELQKRIPIRLQTGHDLRFIPTPEGPDIKVQDGFPISRFGGPEGDIGHRKRVPTAVRNPRMTSAASMGDRPSL